MTKMFQRVLMIFLIIFVQNKMIFKQNLMHSIEEVRKDEDVDGLNARLDDLLDNIRTMNEIEEKQAEVKRQKEERKNERQEGIKIFAPIKKAFQPVQNRSDAVIKVVFAKAFIKLIDWFSDPENQIR